MSEHLLRPCTDQASSRQILAFLALMMLTCSPHRIQPICTVQCKSRNRLVDHIEPYCMVMMKITYVDDGDGDEDDDEVHVDDADSEDEDYVR